MTAILVIIAVLAALLVALAGSAVRILREYERGVIFRTDLERPGPLNLV